MQAATIIQIIGFKLKKKFLKHTGVKYSASNSKDKLATSLSNNTKPSTTLRIPSSSTSGSATVIPIEIVQEITQSYLPKMMNIRLKKSIDKVLISMFSLDFQTFSIVNYKGSYILLNH